LHEIRELVRETFADIVKSDIISVAIEHYAMGAKFGREAAGELGGVLRVMLWENELAYREIPPLQLKQFATGKASAEKDHILLAA
jgi:Holliday junction resolvasome RuvABC endonuclease subunit